MRDSNNNSKVERRTILQSTGAVAGLATIPTISNASQLGNKTAETRIVEITTEFTAADVGEVPHVDLMSSYGIDTENNRFYAFTTDETEVKQFQNWESIVVGDRFDNLPTVVNQNRLHSELPTKTSHGANGFIPVESPVQFPVVNVTAGDNESVTLEVRDEEHSIESGEELALKLSPKSVTRKSGKNVTVSPKIVTRNHGVLSVYINEDGE